ncbi:hypothetical protein Cgig2_020929 [Carnegiea gigantea]|uniref:PGG domain-containing protein n=1 Tax=Carnegiea gigantea TaxID=171969 RepID=A0A9Q1JK13_9CARY|nr:hypothetical protein Cgig2_020929 [Carnegiea gigantea]
MKRGYALQDLAGKRLKPHSPHEGWPWTKLISGRYEARQNKNMHDKGLELVDKLWGKILRDGTKEHRELLCLTVLDAVKNGNVELIVKIFRTYPPAIWKIDQNKRNTFFLAILNRQVKIFNLIYELQGWKVIRLVNTDSKGNNALHMVAKMPPKESLNVVTGAALQMQRELLWFKEVENLVTPQAKVSLNKDKYTPYSLFTANHETLRKDGEKWMKTTATSCFVVAALVATIAFTSALTLPGGDNQNNGIPIFQRDPIFITFAIADAISLVSSSIAIVMFLGILTSRYAQDDFLRSLPLKLLIGLSALFFSIALMMVAFASTFFIIFKAKLPLTSIPAVVAILATIPIGIFALDQFPLLIDIYLSTYGAKHLFRNNHRIYKEKKNGGRGHFLKLKTLALNWLRRNK